MSVLSVGPALLAFQVADSSAAEEAGPAAEARRSPVAFSPSGQAPPLGRRMSRYPAAERCTPFGLSAVTF